MFSLQLLLTQDVTKGNKKATFTSGLEQNSKLFFFFLLLNSAEFIGSRKSQEKFLKCQKACNWAFSQSYNTRENEFIFPSTHNVSGLVCLFDIGVMILTLRFPSLVCVMSPLVLLTEDFKLKSLYTVLVHFKKNKTCTFKMSFCQAGIYHKFCMTFLSLHSTSVCSMVESITFHNMSVDLRGRQ